MTSAQFDRALQAFCVRRPFSNFVVEFMSGNHVLVRHPEAIRRWGDLYTMRLPDGGNIVFPAESVSRLLDVPTTPTT
jgi:hypothetical protein